MKCARNPRLSTCKPPSSPVATGLGTLKTQEWKRGRRLQQIWKADMFLVRQDDCHSFVAFVWKQLLKTRMSCSLSDLLMNWDACSTMCKAWCWQHTSHRKCALCAVVLWRCKSCLVTIWSSAGWRTWITATLLRGNMKEIRLCICTCKSAVSSS